MKFHGTINDPFPLLLPGNEQDLGHVNIVSTYLFYELCNMHDIALEIRLSMQKSHDTLALDFSA